MNMEILNSLVILKMLCIMFKENNYSSFWVNVLMGKFGVHFLLLSRLNILKLM